MMSVNPAELLQVAKDHIAADKKKSAALGGLTIILLIVVGRLLVGGSVPKEVKAKSVAVQPPGKTPAASHGNGALPPLSRVAREHIIRVYRATGFNKTRTARILEIDIKTVYNKLKRYGVE